MFPTQSERIWHETLRVFIKIKQHRMHHKTGRMLTACWCPCRLQGDGAAEPGGCRGGGAGAAEESQGEAERRRDPVLPRAPAAGRHAEHRVSSAHRVHLQLLQGPKGNGVTGKKLHFRKKMKNIFILQNILNTLMQKLRADVFHMYFLPK